MKRKVLVLLASLVISVVTLCAPKYVFLFIGDGLGSAQRQISEYYSTEVNGSGEKLLINQFPVAGINTTHSLDSLVTDSAAAGTALATGHKTDNGVISQLPNGEKVDSIAYYAMKNGMKTGIVSTTRLTHATPAVFVAHNADRGQENEIAAEFVGSGVDFFAGGGYRNFIGKDVAGSKRKDDRDLVAELKAEGYNTFIGEDSVADFKNLDAAKDTKVFATFTSSHMPYELDRVNKKPNLPSLAEVTEKGIEVLSKGDNGFFMMVEGGRIDHAAHAQDAKSVICDTLAFDAAVREAYEFYEKHPTETLIVVAGDHETGGMGMGYAKNYFLKLEELKDVNASVDDTLQKAYTGDRDAFFDYIGKNMGLDDLTDDERESIILAMDIQDAGIVKKATYGSYKPAAVAVAHILSKRANMMFTTFAHSGTQIPLSAIGDGSENFGGFIDNTDIGSTVIELINGSR